MGPFETALRRSLQQRDGFELVALGKAASPRDITHALRTGLESGDRELALAAIAAAQHGEHAWLLLVELAGAAGQPDRPISAWAARAAAQIATALEADTLERYDPPTDVLGDAVAAWRGIADDAERWPDVRVHGLEIAAKLTSLLRALGGDPGPGPGYGNLATRAADPEPEVRRAAFELLPQPPGGGDRVIAARAVADDPDPIVAAAAAQALCSDLLPGRPEPPESPRPPRSPRSPRSPESPSPPSSPESPESLSRAVLDALGDAGLARLRTLVLEPGLPPAAVLDSARCLALDPHPGSVRALRALRSSGPRSIRKPIARLLRRADTP